MDAVRERYTQIWAKWDLTVAQKVAVIVFHHCFKQNRPIMGVFLWVFGNKVLCDICYQYAKIYL